MIKMKCRNCNKLLIDNWFIIDQINNHILTRFVFLIDMQVVWIYILKFFLTEIQKRHQKWEWTGHLEKVSMIYMYIGQYDIHVCRSISMIMMIYMYVGQYDIHACRSISIINFTREFPRQLPVCCLYISLISFKIHTDRGSLA